MFEEQHVKRTGIQTSIIHDATRCDGTEQRAGVDISPDSKKCETRAWFPYLDLARGLAAVLVASGHLRSFVFTDFGTLDHPTLVWSLFYVVTGFSHQAVMAFFVLSGFLVGGAVISRGQYKQWSWIEYAITRITRLWIVLIPALLLTAIWDNSGIAITGSSFYAGDMSKIYSSGPSTDPSQYTLASLLGNLSFLQTIVVPTFGSNAPLWSLANEFWYYVLFPLVFVTMTTQGQPLTRLCTAVGAITLCCILPHDLVLYGLIWLLGVGAFKIATSNAIAAYRKVLFLASGVLLSAALVLTRTAALTGVIGDFAVGAAFAVILVPLSNMRIRSSILAKLSRAGAEVSYTLYLVHFPIAAFLACSLLNNRLIVPSITGMMIYIGLFLIIIVYAYSMYFIFERNTQVARQFILRLLQVRS